MEDQGIAASSSTHSMDDDLQRRMDRMTQAAKASRARRGKATMLQKALDPGKHQSDWDTCSESSCESLSSLRMSNSLSGGNLTAARALARSDSLSPPCRGGPPAEDGARQLMHRLQEMGIEPVVDGPVAPAAQSHNAMNLSFSNAPFPPPLCMEGMDLKSLLYQAPPPRAMVECHILRDNTDKRYPKFELFLEHQRQFLLAARKRKMNTTSNYVISTDREDLDRNSSTFVGKLRANFLGTEFMIYDNGERDATEESKKRKPLGCVVYERNVLGTSGPRRMHVAVPTVDAEGHVVPWVPGPSGGPTFVEAFMGGHRMGMVSMQSAEPEWVPEKHTFVLDFNGRVKKSSVKNFQLQERGRTPILMQFGKVDKDEFIMDFQSPFNLLQAFAIALSSFDSKLACE